MTTSQVYQLLGEPREKIERPNWTAWCYQDACPRAEDGTITGLPSVGFVIFSPVERDPRTGQRYAAAMPLVERFCEPDWSRVPEAERLGPQQNGSRAVNGAGTQRPQWATRAHWMHLQPNMTTAQVCQLLGEPQEKVERPGWAVWCYQDACPKSEDGKVTGLPDSGYVVFTTSKRDPRTDRRLAAPVYIVEKAYEPDWSRVQAIEDETPAPATEESRTSTMPPWQLHASQRRGVIRPEASSQSPPPWQSVSKDRTANAAGDIAPVQKKSWLTSHSTMFFCVAGGIMIGMAITVVLVRTAD